MAERIRSVTVVITVDTNKQTRQRRLSLDEDETYEDFERRIAEAVEQLTEIEP